MKTIVMRELRDHLQSRQFMALLAISLILFGAGGLMSAAKAKQQNEAYRLRTTMARANPSTRGIFLYPSPSPLKFLAEGGDKALPYGYLLTPMGVVDPLPSNTRNIRMPEIPELDWAFLVKIVFSLYAILLGYSAVAGEKEDGTLSLSLANPLGRIRFLAAKGCAILLTLCIPLAAGMLLSLIITGIQNPGIFSGAVLVRIFVMVVLSLVFISVFVSLALFFSSMINPSSLALFLLLAGWFCFAVVMPNTSGIAAQLFAKGPTEYQVSRSSEYAKKRGDGKTGRSPKWINIWMGRLKPRKISRKSQIKFSLKTRSSGLPGNETIEIPCGGESAWLRA